MFLKVYQDWEKFWKQQLEGKFKKKIKSEK